MAKIDPRGSVVAQMGTSNNIKMGQFQKNAKGNHTESSQKTTMVRGIQEY